MFNKKTRILLLFSIIIIFFWGYSYLEVLKQNKVTDATVVGHINYADSLGRQSIDLIEMLNVEDISTNFIAAGRVKKDDLSDYVLKIIRNEGTDRSVGKVMIYERVLKSDKNEIPLRFLFNSFLSWVKDFPRERQIWIAYSMIESTAIPEAWTEKINTYFDAVVVPDPFMVDVYKNSGVIKPIFVIPLSVDIQHMLDSPIKVKRNDVFTFMNLSAITSRKNHIAILKAFHKAFNNDSKVRLVINSRLFKKDSYAELKSYIKENDITNIQITTDTLTKQEYLDLLRTADCYINVSRGEGFSVQPREAMALGIPVIISNNTAQSTIAKSKLVLAVAPSKSVPSYNEFLKLYLGNDFETDIEKISLAMKEIYSNYDYYLSKSIAMRDWSKTYHYDNIKLLYHNLVKPKKLILGNKNEVTATYLETNSKELYNKYQKNLAN